MFLYLHISHYSYSYFSENPLMLLFFFFLKIIMFLTIYLLISELNKIQNKFTIILCS